MTNIDKKLIIPELLAPAGNFEKLKIAFRYGADAVYLGGEAFGLRAFAGNFSVNELSLAADYAHCIGKKIYITLNAFLHNQDLKPFEKYLKSISGIPFDALIVSDPAAILLCREILPDIHLHLSTQSNSTNRLSAGFWKQFGVSRVNLARESTFEEIKESAVLSGVETEVFIHGAMCISYSGRCLISSVLTGRDANKGACTHPCRWSYSLVEETRPGEYFPIEENERGSFIFNSKDLCLIEHIPELVNSAVTALKIEGRMKGIHYLATVVRVYREALDRYAEDPENFRFNPEWLDELKTISHRGYTTGFFLGKPAEVGQEYDSSYHRSCDIIGVVSEFHPDGSATLDVRNRFTVEDNVEHYTKTGRSGLFRIGECMLQESGVQERSFWNPNEQAAVKFPFQVEPLDLIRKPKK